MKRIHGLLCAAVLLGLTAGAVMVGAQSDQPSLADVAKQKSAAKARRVVTNDEIPPSPEANNPPASSAAPAASSAGNAPGAKADAKKADAKKDGDNAGMSAEKQTKLEALMKEVDSLQTIVKTLQDQIDATNDKNRIATLSPVLQHAKEALAANQAEIDKAKAGGAAGSQSGATQPAANQPANAPPTPPK
jgi:chromosome segregation ATPase